MPSIRRALLSPHDDTEAGPELASAAGARAHRTTIGVGATLTSAASGKCGLVSTRSTTWSRTFGPRPSSSMSPTLTGGGTWQRPRFVRPDDCGPDGSDPPSAPRESRSRARKRLRTGAGLRASASIELVTMRPSSLLNLKNWGSRPALTERHGDVSWHSWQCSCCCLSGRSGEGFAGGSAATISGTARTHRAVSIASHADADAALGTEVSARFQRVQAKTRVMRRSSQCHARIRRNDLR